MEEAVKLEADVQFTWRQLINDKSDLKNARRLVIVFVVQMFQQLMGINGIAFYSESEC
jgi:hypothetical protein